jgi:hypothetical protein
MPDMRPLIVGVDCQFLAIFEHRSGPKAPK